MIEKPAICDIILLPHRSEGAYLKSENINNEAVALSALDGAGVNYVLLKHEAADTMEKCFGIGKEYGAEHCKNLFLASRNGKRFCLLMMDAGKPFVTGEVSKKLGLPRMGFGTEEQLESVLGLRQGSVSVLGLLNAQAKRAYDENALKIVVDRDVFERELICVHPNTCTKTLVMKTAELFSFITSLGYSVETVEI